jgi:hypothetical protein
MAESDRIILRLNSGVAYEQDLMERYEALPRPRRQEWIRLVLRLGLEALDRGAVPNQETTPSAFAPPTARLTPAAPASAPLPPAPAYRTAPAPSAVEPVNQGISSQAATPNPQPATEAGDGNRDPKQLLGMW